MRVRSKIRSKDIFLGSLFATPVRTSDLIVLLLQYFSTQFPPKLGQFIISRTSFSIPCWQKTVSCLINHRNTYVSTPKSSLDLWLSRFSSTLETDENRQEPDYVPGLLSDKIKCYMNLFYDGTSYSLDILYNFRHILQKLNSQSVCEKNKGNCCQQIVTDLTQ
jgi:hypothetical protein